MKTKKDPRHISRIEWMSKLYAWNFHHKPDQSISHLTLHLKKIDQAISLAAPERPLSQINQVDLAILRLATFELIIKKQVPPKVVLDEAIELGKAYGSESSSSFINGCLGNLIEQEGITT